MSALGCAWMGSYIMFFFFCFFFLAQLCQQLWLTRADKCQFHFFFKRSTTKMAATLMNAWQGTKNLLFYSKFYTCVWLSAAVWISILYSQCSWNRGCNRDAHILAQNARAILKWGWHFDVLLFCRHVGRRTRICVFVNGFCLRLRLMNYLPPTG